MKTRIPALISAAVVCAGLTAVAVGENNVNVKVNGADISKGAYIIENSVYVPLRAVGEALGADVSWTIPRGPLL